MKQKELEELKLKDLDEIVKLAQGKKLESIKVKAETKAGKEKNLKKTKFLRHDLAQILTLAREKELANKIKG